LKLGLLEQDHKSEMLKINRLIHSQFLKSTLKKYLRNTYKLKTDTRLFQAEKLAMSEAKLSSSNLCSFPVLIVETLPFP